MDNDRQFFCLTRRIYLAVSSTKQYYIMEQFVENAFQTVLISEK